MKTIFHKKDIIEKTMTTNRFTIVFKAVCTVVIQLKLFLRLAIQ